MDKEFKDNKIQDAGETGFDIPEELKKLPTKPGVYLMHGPKDEIIYVGKAVNLRNRVRQYFQSSRGKSAKILRMVSLIRRFEYVVVDSELEALVLENNLIKEYKPKYNTLLKDDKTYPYIKVSMGEAFPRIMSVRRVKKDKGRYFGPYTSGLAVNNTIDLLHKLFKIRTCSRVLPRDMGKERPCLYYHLGQCMAPCNGLISEEEYRESILKALDFLSGKYDEVKKYLTGCMNEASEAMEFEKAAEYRDLLRSIDEISSRQKVTALDTDDRDIIGIFKAGHEAIAQVFFIRDGRLIGREHFHIETDEREELKDTVQSFVKQFYTGTPYIPKEIWLQAEIDEEELLSRWLSEAKGRKVRFLSPKKGQKEKLVEMAVNNAKSIYERDSDKIKREEQRTKGAMREIGELLGLPDISRVESYDISNTQGFESVGSMVVFVDGRPKNSDYRKFRIKSVAGPNDYASMEEVLERRFTHGLRELSGEDLEKDASEAADIGEDKERDGKRRLRRSSFSAFPDLIMMDGGKGQVNVALKVLSKLGLSIPVCGMVKDDRHRTRGLYFNNEELPIDIHSEGFRLITRIQDETHRFAIEFHKSLRSKAGVHSVLDDIKGVGEKRRRELMRHFKDMESLRNASVEELSELPSMDRRAAESVYAFFHEDRQETAAAYVDPDKPEGRHDGMPMSIEKAKDVEPISEEVTEASDAEGL